MDNLRCRDCPYGKEDYDRLSKFCDEEDIENYVWCDKVGGKVYCFGHCTDFYEDIDIVKQKNSSKKKRINKRERDKKYKNHLKQLSKSSSGFPSGAVYFDEIWIKGKGYVKNPKPYYKRLYRGQRSKYLKKQSHKAIRRYKGELHNGNMCHKIYDFWWEYS